MNKSLIYLLFLSLFALSACSDAESFDTEQQQPSSRQALTLSVCASDFATYSDGALDTRATNNGATTTFVNGDRVGVIILDGANLSADNIPYTYNGSSWVFDAANSEGKTPYYYDNKATNVTYIVYYPYSSEANGIKTKETLKAKFPPLSNQSTEAAYSASDLLFGEQKSTTPLKTLSAELKHVYASVSLVPQMKYTLANGSVLDVSSSISDVSFSIGNDAFVAHKATGGNYCCILPTSASSVDIRYLYTYIAEKFQGTLTASSGTAANTRYTSTATYSKIYAFTNVRIGDFYCKDADGNAYLIPGDILTELTDAQKTACLGIVYWLGNITGDNYGALNSKFPDGTRGLVACKTLLYNWSETSRKEMTWNHKVEGLVSKWLEQDERWWNIYNDITWGGVTFPKPNGLNTIYAEDKMQGYINTIVSHYFNNKIGNERDEVLPVLGLFIFNRDILVPPTSSSGWYFPSIYELKMMCWGQGNTQGVAGRDMLHKQFSKLGEDDEHYWKTYWSSSEYSRINFSGNNAWSMAFNDGVAQGTYKLNNEYFVRPVLAF